MDLFREEAQAEQTGQWLGVVRLARPLSFAVVTGSVLLILCGAVLFLTFAEVTHKARLTGMLVPTEGSINVTTPEAGVVMERKVSEGQAVQAGDTLLVLSIERKSLTGAAVQNTSREVASSITARQHSLQMARHLNQLRAAQEDVIALDKIRSLDAELVRADEELRLQKKRVELAQQTVERLQDLAKEGYLPESKLQDKQEALIDAMGQLQSMQRNRLTLARDRQALDGERKSQEMQLQLALNSLEREQSALQQEAAENSAHGTVVVTAPCAGLVSGMEIQAGQSVATGQTLLTVIPVGKNQKQLEAHLFAPSRAVGFVEKGQTVYLRYAAYPYQKFGMYSGKINHISATPFSPNELPPHLAQQVLAQAGSVEGLYRISVELDQQTVDVYGASLPLKPGLSLEADVVEHKLSIWEMIFEPLLAARATFMTK